MHSLSCIAHPGCTRKFSAPSIHTLLSRQLSFKAGQCHTGTLMQRPVAHSSPAMDFIHDCAGHTARPHAFPELLACCSSGTLTSMASQQCSAAVDHSCCATHQVQLKQCLRSAPLRCGYVVHKKNMLCSEYTCRFIPVSHKHLASAQGPSLPPTVGLEPTTTRFRALRSAG